MTKFFFSFFIYVIRYNRYNTFVNNVILDVHMNDTFLLNSFLQIPNTNITHLKIPDYLESYVDVDNVYMEYSNQRIIWLVNQFKNNYEFE